MAHVPHLYLPPPWGGSLIELDSGTARHLERVLRRAGGSPVSYTDGAGTLGTGMLEDGGVRRGPERSAAPPPDVTIAAASPHAVERARFLVEKCAELGVRRVVWITTEHGRNRPPKPEKAQAWAVAALQQSRGAHLTEIGGPVALADVPSEGDVLVADPGGRPAGELEWRLPVSIVIGPEGGLTLDETAQLPQLSLGNRILRTETAAVVAAAAVLLAVRSP